jgi:hypothetical protein
MWQQQRARGVHLHSPDVSNQFANRSKQCGNNSKSTAHLHSPDVSARPRPQRVPVVKHAARPLCATRVPRKSSVAIRVGVWSEISHAEHRFAGASVFKQPHAWSQLRRGSWWGWRECSRRVEAGKHHACQLVVPDIVGVALVARLRVAPPLAWWEWR